MLELSAGVPPKHKDAERVVSSITFEQVPQCMVLVVKYSVHAPNCIILVGKCGVNTSHCIVLVVECSV